MHSIWLNLTTVWLILTRPGALALGIRRLSPEPIPPQRRYTPQVQLPELDHFYKRFKILPAGGFPLQMTSNWLSTVFA